MAKNVINIDSDNLAKLSNRLEQLSRTDIPRVIQKTLNNAALDMKTKTLINQTDKEFTNRRRNFFKANSSIEFAKRSKNINEIKSTVGFVSTKLKGRNNAAVENLEQQERGGKIEGKSFIPLDTARVSGSYKRNVRSAARLTNVNKMIRAKNKRGKTPGQRFVVAANEAGAGGHVLSERGILWRINSLKRGRDGRFKTTPLYSYESKRSITVKPRRFMEKSAYKSGGKLDEIYISEAKKQINFRLNK